MNTQAVIKQDSNTQMDYAQGKIRAVEDHTFATHDEVELFYRYWPALAEQPKGAIILFHRGHEHSGRLSHLVEELDLKDYAFFAWDARGHGRSPGARGYSPDMASSIRDIQTFVQHIHKTYGYREQDMAIIAQSVGAVTAAAWVHDYAPSIRSMVLASPAFKVKLYVPFARSGLKLMQAVRGQFYINSYVKAKFLTHDQARIDSYNNDPLITRAIASNILLGLYDTAERVVADAAAITVPTQLLISGSDWVVDHKPQHQFYENLGSVQKERIVLDGFYHDTLGEKDRHLAIEKVRAFIVKGFDHCVSRELEAEGVKYALRHADKQGFTRQEADQLATPLPVYSIKGLYWSVSKVMLKMAGFLSKGIRLGHDTGFDSGSTLDYVYNNSPQGIGRLGKFIDKQYLQSVGWRGIRQRKQHIEELVHLATERLQAQGQRIDIMDIAAGHGRYILDAVSKTEQDIHSVLLRDYSERNVLQGRELIADKGLQKTARFIQANAFDPASYEQAQAAISLGVVSGLYELFADNALIKTSLQGLANTIKPGGYLIYTNQPWHPQLEVIARTLTSHRQGNAWVMRRRTQAEMDQLVEDAGFSKIEQRIDPYGIFTVSLAVRKQD